MGVQWAAGLLLAVAPAVGTHGDERLAALIDEALQNNPGIRMAFADYQAALHRVPQAASLPDPRLSVTQFTRSIETRVGPQRRMLSVSQDIPGFGKRAARSQLASKSAATADEMHQARRADVARQVKRTYFSLGFIDRAIDVSLEDEALLKHIEELARDRYAQGFGLQADVVRLQAQITRSMSDRVRLVRQRVDLESALNSIRGLPPDSPVGKVRLPERPAVKLDRRMLVEAGLHQRPELRAALSRIEEREKGVDLARKHFRPDFSVGVTWGNVRARGVPSTDMPLAENGKDSYGLTFGMTLPLRRARLDAGVREAAEAMSAAREAYRDAANRMEAEVRSITFELETIQRQMDLYQKALLPQAEQALLSTQAAYSAGSEGVVSLLDIQRELLDVRLGLARLHADYLGSIADLERAIGTAVPEEDPS